MDKQIAITKTYPTDLEKARIRLGNDETHVWYARLDSLATDSSSLLSREEQDRAESYHFPRDRHNYILRHGIFRQLISLYSNMEPQQIQFEYNDTGKPSLANPYEEPNLFFNQSHSAGLAVYAFTRTGDVGIDVEHIHEVADISGIANAYFAPTESIALRILSGENKTKAFFNCWVRKEAVIKATGEGLSQSLDKIDVSPIVYNSGEASSYTRVYADGACWYIYDLDIDKAYKAAVTVKQPVERISVFNAVFNAFN